MPTRDEGAALSRPGTAWARRLSVVGAGIAAALVLAALLLPLRVSYGAGSLRCGSPIAPVPGPSEFAEDCRRAITAVRMPAAAITVAAVLVGAAVPWLVRPLADRHRWVRSATTVVLTTWWLVATLLGLFAMTGAYGPPLP